MAAGSANDGPGSILTLLTGVFRFFTDPGGFFSDAVKWLSGVLFPPELQTWFMGTIGYPDAAKDSNWDATQIYETLFRVVQAPALLIAAAAAGIRVLRGILDQRAPAIHALVDALPRFLVCVAVIGIPGTGVSLGYSVIVWAVNASVSVAGGLFTTFLHASLLRGIGTGQNWFGDIVQALGNGGRGLIVVVIGFIPLLIMFLYAAFLMVLRTIMLGFCVATAPLCFATAAFDVRNRFLQYWLDMFVGAALTPVVMAVAISVSFTLASSVVSALVVGPVLAIVILIGGVWMSGKLVHHLTWRHFAHGGAMAGFAAGVSAMLGPIQRLASAGFLAEALGANRNGGNRAVELMKRLGVAAQGFHPGGAATPSLLSVTRQHADGSARTGVPDINAEDGPPRIDDALSGPGRQVVVGSEQHFNQQAFNAFAQDHQSLVGALTKDREYGSLGFGDRAKLAWERVSPRGQAAFAEEYLSHWLGGDGFPVLEDSAVATADVA